MTGQSQVQATTCPRLYVNLVLKYTVTSICTLLIKEKGEAGDHYYIIRLCPVEYVVDFGSVDDNCNSQSP